VRSVSLCVCVDVRQLNNRAVEVGFKKPRLLGFYKSNKNLRSQNFKFLGFFTYCVTNLIIFLKMKIKLIKIHIQI